MGCCDAWISTGSGGVRAVSGAQAADMPDFLWAVFQHPTRNWDGWYVGGEVSYRRWQAISAERRRSDEFHFS
jgi:hypothetical protein